MSAWHSDDLDLSAYLERIGLSGPLPPTLGTLRALHRAHVTSIPFENAEIILGRPVPLDLASLQAKLVGDRRGGYCFEHAALFGAVLERLGFRFTALTGRVVVGGGDPATRPATHALLVVEFDDGSRHLCDVGFGRGPLEPIPLVHGAETDQDGWRFRLARETMDDLFATDRWTLRQHGREWAARHVFTLNPQSPIDWVVGNHFVSTSSRSPFTARTFAQRFSAAEHHTLDATTWTVALPDGQETVREVEPERLPTLLAEIFGIELDDPDGRALVAAETARAAKNHQ